MADPDAPAVKRLRLDSVNPAFNGHTFPPPPPPHTRPLSHPVQAQASSPPPSRHYPAHSLPPPSGPYPASSQGPYSGPQPSPSLPPSDIRALADPRNIPSPGQRPHGVHGPSPVTVHVSQDSISTYRAPPTPQSATAVDHVSQDSISTYRAPPTPQSATAVDHVDAKPPPGMEHGNHQGHWSMNPDHRSNGSVSNGYNQSISPPHPNDQAYHPPSQPSGQQYGQPSPYAPSPYMSQYSSSAAAAQVRRKQVRATQACNHCRARKQKCDEARPCQFCRENNFDCQYKDVPPPKQDRSMMQLQDSINNISDVLKDFVGEINAWRQDVESRLSRGAFESTSIITSPETAIAHQQRNPSTSRMPTPLQGRHPPGRVNSMKMESPMVPHSHMSPTNAQSTPIKLESLMQLPQQPATPADSVRTDTSRATNPGPKVRAGLQSDHSTPAHKLFEEWPLMRDWPHGVEYLQKLTDSGRALSDYPMQLEQDRGLLRPWGIGEGFDLSDGAQGPGSPDSSTEVDTPSPVPGKEGLWGHPPDQASPSAANSSVPRDNVGGLGKDGRPDFRAKVVDELLSSYIENMHNLHPFLNRPKLQKMVRDFKEQYSPDAKAMNVQSPAAHQLNPGLKRKRSSSAFGEPYSSRGAIERSLRNAIILLVLALGKVCSYKKNLPSPQSDKCPQASGAWGSFNHTSQSNGSFNSDASEDGRPRNIDIMPGMAYFSYATDILGNQQGGHTVAHAQAMILAALYISQFARVLESWSWINSACRITMVLLKADYPKLKREFYLSGEDKKVLTPKERYKLDLVLLAYWTCLQLESDIVAELSTLPTSHITTYQNYIMYPAGVCESFPSEQWGMAVLPASQTESVEGRNMIIYSSQIYLRVLLNEAHNMLYGAGGSKSFDKTDAKAVAAHTQAHIQLLQEWRDMLPDFLAWNDNSIPSSDLNIARIRAKYYGGLYMMLRPYLRIAAGREWPPSHQSSHQGSHQTAHWSHHSSPAANGESSSTLARGVQMVELSNDQKDMINLACLCINSAVRSTIAFDRVGAPEGSPYEEYKSTRAHRLIVTNIFGTVHAQFGNMLVLAAVYKSKMYQHLPHDTPLTPRCLNALFERTFEILEQNAPNSPILQVDLDILRNVRNSLTTLPRTT